MVVRRKSDALNGVVMQLQSGDRRWVESGHRKDDWRECANQISEGTALELGSRTRPG